MSNTNPVKAKKHLGQHFLTDENIAQKIANTLSYSGYNKLLEIGPGTGVLTKYLLKKDITVYAIELDTESVSYLKEKYPLFSERIIEADFLKFNLATVFGTNQLAIIGNFPYNISTQIVFKTLENRKYIPEFSGMFQKEVAQRICEPKGSRTYGILSVLTQAFYKTEYLFSVPPQVFNPPPKVNSGVLLLTRHENYSLDCNESLFFRVVKMAFNQRRKTLRNSLKSFNLNEEIKQHELLSKRAEQLGVPEFIQLTQFIEKLQL